MRVSGVGLQVSDSELTKRILIQLSKILLATTTRGLFLNSLITVDGGSPVPPYIPHTLASTELSARCLASTAKVCSQGQFIRRLRLV